jgi:hypothetical protein
METTTRPERTLAGLAADFPSWHIWRGRDGRGADKAWYATRKGQRPTAAELDAGLAATLSADDATSLHDRLTKQLVIQGGRQAVRRDIP